MTTARRSPVLVLVLAAGAAASACDSGAAKDPNHYTLLDDMEGDVNQIAWTAPGSTPGRWAIGVDCAQVDRLQPPPYVVDPNGAFYTTLPSDNETFPGVTSTKALRFRTTTPLTDTWGANVIANFATTGLPDAGAASAGCELLTWRDFPSPTVDLTAYSGITFWAKAEAGAKSLLVKINDRNTDPRGGACNAADPDDDGDCYNGYGTRITLTNTFERYTIDFANLAQDPEWGYRPEPNIVDLGHVYTMYFELRPATCVLADTLMCAGGVSPPLSFDVWLDDLYFVKVQP